MSIGVLLKQSKMEDMANRKSEVATKLGLYWLRGFSSISWRDCATSSDHVVIYGINLGFDHELKILSCPEPGSRCDKGCPDKHHICDVL